MGVTLTTVSGDDAEVITVSTLFVVVVLVQTATARFCPGGHNRPPCFFISPDPMDWYKAQEYCWGHGGFLAELKSEEVDLAIDHHLSSDEYYWIGATDVAMEGTFKWAESHQGWGDYDCSLNEHQEGWFGHAPIKALCQES